MVSYVAFVFFIIICYLFLVFPSGASGCVSVVAGGWGWGIGEGGGCTS